MNTQKHRHFVAAPVLTLVLLCVFAVHSALPVGASVLTSDSVELRATEKAETMQIGDFTAVKIEPGSVFSANDAGDALTLKKGQALIRSDALSATTIGKTIVHALDGSFLVIREGSITTIAPLSAPIIVITQTEEIPLLPGSQAIVKSEAASVRRVPAEWFAEQRKLADSLKIEKSDTAVLPMLVAGVQSGRLTEVSLQSLITESTELDETHVLMRLVLVRLLLETTRLDEKAATLLARTMTEEAMLQTIASSLPGFVQTLGKSLPPPVIQEWKQAALSAGLDDTPTMLRAIHESVSLPRLLKDAGFPVQSTLWRDALLHVAQMMRTSVPAVDLPTLDADIATITRGMTIIDVPAEDITEKSSTNWSEEELVTLVRNLLITHGVLMGTMTELVPNVAKQTVDVSGVFIGEKTGDAPYKFTVDVAYHRITSIVRAGELQPNTLTVDAFFKE
jgi:hypothetical protein